MSEKLPINYINHCHTYRCGHSEIKEEEIIAIAISKGVKRIAFTDHCPLPNVTQHGIRMDMEDLPEYVSSLKYLKDKYKKQIEIGIGLEVEYNRFDDQYIRDFFKSGIEFIVIGQHYIYLDGESRFFMKDNSDKIDLYLEEYVKTIKAAIDSGLVKYLAHPDIFIYSVRTYDDRVEKAATEIIKYAVEHNITLEYNIHGYYNTDSREIGYPNFHFWKIVKDKFPNAKITIGLDAHYYHEINEPKNLVNAINDLKKLGLTINE